MDIKSVTNFLGLTYARDTDAPVTDRPKIDLTNVEKRQLIELEYQPKIERKIMDSKLQRTLIIIGVVVCLLLGLMQEYFLILVIGSICFFMFALSKSQLGNIRVSISTHGITYDSGFFNWNDLRHFFFMNEGGSLIVAIDTVDRLPGRLYIVADADKREKLKTILSDYLPYLEKEPETVIDKAYKGMLGRLNTTKK